MCEKGKQGVSLTPQGSKVFQHGFVKKKKNLSRCTIKVNEQDRAVIKITMTII